MSDGPRGAPGRVAEVHRQTRPTLILAALFLLAAPVAQTLTTSTRRWIPVHLALAGGLVLAVSGATQMLAVTWGAGPPPRRGVVHLQRALVAIGAVTIVAGRQWTNDALLIAGGTATVAGLVLLAAILVSIGRAAVQRRVRPPVVAYVAACTAGVGGVVLGAWLGAGGGRSDYAMWREVHRTVNLLGLAGLVVAGTLPFFVATQARTKMSPHATLAVQYGVIGTIALALGLATGGLVGHNDTVVTIGLALYAATLLGLVSVLPSLGEKQWQWAGPRLGHVVAAIVWWIGAVAVAAMHAADGRQPFSGSVVPALVLGGYVQLIVGSLAYLGPVLVGGGHERLAESFGITRTWIGPIAANVAVGAAVAGGDAMRPVYALALAVWTLDAAARAAWLVMQRS